MKEECFFTKKSIDNIKLVLFSDIHYSNKFNLKIFDKILKQTKNYDPDYIFITGDIIDNVNVKFDNLVIFLKELEKINRVFICLGNHDLFKGFDIDNVTDKNWEKQNINRFKRIIDSLNNTIILDNDTYIDKKNNISISGLTLGYDYYNSKEDKELFIKELKKANFKLNSNNYNILLLHSPQNIINCKNLLNDFDLILAGHMHGGLIPQYLSFIFGNNKGLISPQKKLFPSNARGPIKTNYFDGYIYDGITKLSPSSTFFLYIFNWLYPIRVKNIKINKINTL